MQYEIDVPLSVLSRTIGGRKAETAWRRARLAVANLSASIDELGMTPTGLPLIGPVPRHPGVHAVLGYSGNGITFSRIAAEILRAELTGSTDADAGLFAFGT